MAEIADALKVLFEGLCAVLFIGVFFWGMNGCPNFWSKK